MCSTSVSQQKGMFCNETECISSPLRYSSSAFFSVLTMPRKKVLNPKESSRQVQFPSPALPDTEKDIYPQPFLSSPSDLGVFIFRLLRWLTPKPPCFPLKTFLFALDISALFACALRFSICFFFAPIFYFIFSQSSTISLSHPFFTLF